MEIVATNADQKLINIASSISKNRKTWEGWFCLSLQLDETPEESYQDCLIWTKSIINSYLKDVKGHVYLCSNKNIHILGKTITNDVLKQTGDQITDIILAETGLKTHFIIYNLARDGDLFTEHLLEQIKNFSSYDLPDLNIVKEPHLEEKPTLNASSEITRVLLVEDDPVTRWIVRNTLRNECEFLTAPTAHKAFGIYNSYQPDIVFLDINLPDDDGYSVLKWIMHNDPGARVVMFSSNDNLDNITAAIEEGASGFIAKPFLKEQLLHYVHQN